MVRQPLIRRLYRERHRGESRLRDFILGWQDGLVNVLGVILGVAAATQNAKIIIISAMAAAFAESISMMAVAYTSFKAEADFYRSELEKEKYEIEHKRSMEVEEVRKIFKNLGFTGKLLKDAVERVTSSKRRWLRTMMESELKLMPPKASPLNIATVVGISAFTGSLIPVLPFALLPVRTAVIVSLILSTSVLFMVGAYKAKTTIGNPIRSGIEMAIIGMMAAIVGYTIGSFFAAVITG
ncbi:MAG: VIT1/CCC1 transporter family protein [Candidatus Aenigmatarchaeota archaeon]